MRYSAWTLALLSASSQLAAATFRVGSSVDPACDFNSLANAIAAASANGPGMDEIRLARNLSTNAVSLTITDQNLEIAGGYADCGANADAMPSTIPGSSTAAGVSLITIQGNAPETWRLTLRNLQLIGNRGDDSARGGALRIGGYTVELIDTALLSNRAGRGGGAYLEGPGARLLLDGARSTILSNIATIAGGGVYCTDRGRIEILTGAIDRNQVMGTLPLDPSDLEGGNGGGAALLGGCELIVRDGDASSGLRGITQNTARRDGGGVFLSGGSVLRGIGDAQRPARFQFNRAPAGRGGAIFAFDPAAASAPSRVELSNTQFERNDAGEGGLWLWWVRASPWGARSPGATAMTRSVVRSSVPTDSAAPRQQRGAQFSACAVRAPRSTQATSSSSRVPSSPACSSSRTVVS